MTTIELPAVWSVLGLLLGPDKDKENLEHALSLLQQDFQNSKPSIAYEFAPFILEQLTQKNLISCTSGELIQTLKGFARSAAARSIARNFVIKQIGERFVKSDIQAVLLKGAAMDGYIYPKSAFRMGSDVDILVQDKDYERVEKSLNGIAKRVDKFSGKPAKTKMSVECTYTVQHPAYVQLDIHRELTIPYVYPIDYSNLIDRSVAHPSHGELFKLLSPEDNLLHFSMHAFYDLSMFQKQTVDAFMLLKHHDVNWSVLLERAKKYKVVMPLVYFLEGVRRIFSFEPPEDVKQILERRGITRDLAYKILVPDLLSFSGPSAQYRIRQLISWWLLSGNMSGFFSYQLKYGKAWLKDRAR